MKERDIRPVRLMNENVRLHAMDVKRLLRFKDRFTKVPCPACGSIKYNILFKKGGFSFVSCGKCETLYVNPRPSLEMLKEFYTASKSIKHWNDKIFLTSENARRSEIFVPRAKKVAKLCEQYAAGTGMLLDVGAGFGTFCEEIRQLGVFDDVVAVEPSQDLAATCRRKGLNVIQKPIEEVDVKRANVITCFELIEHLYDPETFIIACRNVLPKDGLLIATTPNIKGFDLSILGRFSDNIVAPNHLNYFHPDSLKQLLGRCGFETACILTPGKLDADIVRNKILKGEFNVPCGFMKEILINEWESVGGRFQQFLAENNLSSHLWVVARPR